MLNEEAKTKDASEAQLTVSTRDHDKAGKGMCVCMCTFVCVCPKRDIEWRRRIA